MTMMNWIDEAEAAQDERQAIVKWLRNYAVLLQDPTIRGIALKIEHGEHLRGDDE